MERTIELETQAWTAAGNLVWDFSTIDDEVGDDLLSGSCVIIEAALTFTCGVGGGVTARELMEWITVTIQGGPFVSPMVSGVNAWDLCNYLEGAEGVAQVFAADAAADAQYEKQVVIIIPYRSSYAPRAKENWPLSKACSRQNLKLRLGAAAVNANTNMDSAEFMVEIKLHRGHEARLAHYRCIESFTRPLRDKLPAGGYDGAVFIPPAGTGFAAAANITQVRVVGDGDEIHSTISPEACLLSYLEDLGYAIGGADNTGTPLVGSFDWVLGYDSVQFFPLIWLSRAPYKNKMGQLPAGKNGMLCDCDGGLSTIKYVIGYIPPLGGAFEKKAIRQLGAENSAVTVERDVTPGMVARRPSLAGVPFVVKATSNLAKAGELSNNLGARQVFPDKGSGTAKMSAPGL